MLFACDVPDRTQRRATDLTGALCDRIRHGKDLARLLVEQQVIVAEMRPAHMPMEVLGLEIDREHIRQKWAQRSRYVTGRIGCEARRCAQAFAFVAFTGIFDRCCSHIISPSRFEWDAKMSPLLVLSGRRQRGVKSGTGCPC